MFYGFSLIECPDLLDFSTKYIYLNLLKHDNATLTDQEQKLNDSKERRDFKQKQLKEWGWAGVEKCFDTHQEKFSILLHSCKLLLKYIKTK